MDCDHGAFSGNQTVAVDFLYNNNIIAFIIFVVAIITSEFWFEFFHQILREITGRSEPTSLQMLTMALVFTVVFVILTYWIFKVPVAASFTL